MNGWFPTLGFKTSYTDGGQCKEDTYRFWGQKVKVILAYCATLCSNTITTKSLSLQTILHTQTDDKERKTLTVFRVKGQGHTDMFDPYLIVTQLLKDF